jgi:hypothetical protein
VFAGEGKHYITLFPLARYGLRACKENSSGNSVM